MRFEVRDLTVSLLPRHAGENNPTGCTPSPTGGQEGGCTPSPPRNCTPSPPNPPNCTPSPTGPERCGNPSGEPRETRAGRASLGLLRQQLRQHLSQPGAC